MATCSAIQAPIEEPITIWGSRVQTLSNISIVSLELLRHKQKDLTFLPPTQDPQTVQTLPWLTSCKGRCCQDLHWTVHGPDSRNASSCTSAEPGFLPPVQCS